MRIAVTGGSGKGGAWVVHDLREHDHEVLSVDWRPDSTGVERTLVTDLTDLGQTQDALSGVDAVVHFAAIPAPLLRPEGETFRINALSTYNVFAAAEAHRFRRVVWASSETVVQFARRSGIGFVGLRISNIMAPEDYAGFAAWQDDPTIRKWNLWSYVDARDVAQAVRLALEAPIEGAEVAIIAASDSVMTRPSAELMAEVFPTVPLRHPVEGRQTLLSIERARRVLGYEPGHRWADHV